MKVYDENGNSVGDVELDREKFNKVRLPVLRQVINTHEINIHTGTASTKTKAEVAGSGKKPWAQKHLGRARAGCAGSPIWRGGGVAFGPKPNSKHKRIPKKIKRIALNSAITSKLDDEEVFVIDKLNFDVPSTKKMVQILKSLGINESCLIVIQKDDDLIWKSARNLRSVEVKNVSELNAYSVISQKKILITQDAVESLNTN